MRKLALALLLATAACGGEDDEPPPVMTGKATLTRVEAEVFAISCAFVACHAPPAPEKGLDLTGDTHAKLVGVMSKEKPGTPLVTPGQPDASFVMDKVLGRNLPMAPATERAWEPMPPPRGGLSAEQTELLRAWIAAGALDD